MSGQSRNTVQVTIKTIYIKKRKENKEHPSTLRHFNVYPRKYFSSTVKFST